MQHVIAKNATECPQSFRQRHNPINPIKRLDPSIKKHLIVVIESKKHFLKPVHIHPNKTILELQRQLLIIKLTIIQ